MCLETNDQGKVARVMYGRGWQRAKKIAEGIVRSPAELMMRTAILYQDRGRT